MARRVIVLLESYIQQLGYTPAVHFELEGCYRFPSYHAKRELDFALVNRQLRCLGIDAELVPEYWSHQWEYVSVFNGQAPLKEADNLAFALEKLPYLFARQGVEQTLIKPVIWYGDNGQLAPGCNNVFSSDVRAVHIPNAVQINISASDDSGENIIAKHGFGEYLQQCFLQTSLGCCLLYLPEEDAFERLALKSRYGLAKELCSPVDISGGHQGSIALYKQYGKHNQDMGVEPLLYGAGNQVLLSRKNWRKTARIEHRLGASSCHYNPYLNVVFALANLIDALEVYNNKGCEAGLKPSPAPVALPAALNHDKDGFDAVSLFARQRWFRERINAVQLYMQTVKGLADLSVENSGKLGDKLQNRVLAKYQQKTFIR
ncbi:hypothetical protein H3N35_24525 [Thalassomonas haliotis]|uniref:GS catalytic domain-containing protein n=1 Tax=Thalassomonas haliotis TaxID=485448 RepID=A0ABY7VNC5_9GAMM|nr:hypothetical protein H3N35_24525 [Thalassomonas haliotis]